MAFGFRTYRVMNLLASLSPLGPRPKRSKERSFKYRVCTYYISRYLGCVNLCVKTTRVYRTLRSVGMFSSLSSHATNLFFQSRVSLTASTVCSRQFYHGPWVRCSDTIGSPTQKRRAPGCYDVCGVGRVANDGASNRDTMMVTDVQ